MLGVCVSVTLRASLSGTFLQALKIQTIVVLFMLV